MFGIWAPIVYNIWYSIPYCRIIFMFNINLPCYLWLHCRRLSRGWTRTQWPRSPCEQVLHGGSCPENRTKLLKTFLKICVTSFINDVTQQGNNCEQVWHDGSLKLEQKCVGLMSITTCSSVFSRGVRGNFQGGRQILGIFRGGEANTLNATQDLCKNGKKLVNKTSSGSQTCIFRNGVDFWLVKVWSKKLVQKQFSHMISPTLQISDQMVQHSDAIQIQDPQWKFRTYSYYVFRSNFWATVEKPD